MERDDWTPWYERTKAELAQLAQAEIHVGILGSAGGELLKIAAVHEFGATIHPRNAKNLAIPLSPRARGAAPGTLTTCGPMITARTASWSGTRGRPVWSFCTCCCPP